MLGADFVVPSYVAASLFLRLNERPCYVVTSFWSWLENHPKPMAVKELAYRKCVAQFLKEFPHTEIIVTLKRVVQKHDTPGPQLGPPRVEIMSDGLIGMCSVDMKEVDRFVAE